MTLPENSTVGIMYWNVCPGGAPVKAAWSASGPVNIYVLNTKQYAALLLPSLNIVAPPSLQNFSGMPVSWVSRYYLQNGSVSISLPPGWLLLSRVVEYAVSPELVFLAGGSCPHSSSVRLPGLILIALGPLALVLPVAVVKRLIWHQTSSP
jgi:hypothetical protein